MKQASFLHPKARLAFEHTSFHHGQLAIAIIESGIANLYQSPSAFRRPILPTMTHARRQVGVHDVMHMHE